MEVRGPRGRLLRGLLPALAAIALLSGFYSGLVGKGTEVIVDERGTVETMEEGAARVARVCFLAPGSSPLRAPPASPGVETVLLPGDPPVRVCVPHKAGSHAWGEFARRLAEIHPVRSAQLQAEDWRAQAGKVLRVVVVRHPLERLVSAYRMIFQDWCDPASFIRARWPRSCSSPGLEREEAGAAPVERVRDAGSAAGTASLLAAVWDEWRHGQDRYMARVWRGLHPGLALPPGGRLTFTFPEFIRLVVNGSREFSGDEYVARHRGLAYHWAPYWQECPPCSPLTAPHLVLRLERLEQELPFLLGRAGLAQHAALFPHTHSQPGGASSALTAGLLAQLGTAELAQLKEHYALDLQLYGYT